MKKNFLVLIVVLLACAAAVAFWRLPALHGKRASVMSTVDREGRPLALGKHLDKLKQTIPGNEGESPDGPGGGDAQKLAALAYPDTDIPIERIDAARSAAAAVAGRKLRRGKGQPGTWVSVGPSTALYPFFSLRDTTVYVPNTYIAGGRTSTMAIAPSCSQASCKLWIGAAGGGVWRTKQALAGNPNWEYLSGPFGINAMGILVLDPNDSSGNTLWAGTGEANSSADSVYGVGLYKTTDGGDTWSGPFGTSVFDGRAVGTIAVKPGDPNTIYAGSARAVHGMSSVIGGAVTVTIPGAAIWGLYKSSDGGATWTLIHNGAATVSGCTVPAVVATNTTPCSPRGVRRVGIDPADPATVYASSYARGIWRSNDEGATWTQIYTPLSEVQNTDRAEFAVTLLPTGQTRMYVGDGHTGASGQFSRFFRSDDVRTLATPVFTSLTSASEADPGYGSFDYCTGQCWYDNYVYTPPGEPDMVYLSGSNQYNETGGSNWVSNGRGVVLSQDAGVSWTDMTYDATDFLHPNGSHPDHHVLVTNPSNPFQFFEGGDGGIMRSSGQLTNISSQCSLRGTTGDTLTRCQQLLSAVPTVLKGINKGLSTLQFQSVSINPFDSNDVQGGTQDNGTWENYNNPVKWTETMIGDGGQSGFDIASSSQRFHTFFLGQVDNNLSGGAVAAWNWISDPFWVPPFFEGNSASFYIPIIYDPAVTQSLYAGLLHVWRTKTYGLGSLTPAELVQHCNEWTGDFTTFCGDWLPLGDPGAGGQLISTVYGSDRAGTFVAAVERAPSDTSTMWAATGTGRVFVSKNADAEPASSVTFTRIDTLATNDPNRFPSGIAIDPANPNHAWISYTGFSAATPTTPGHIFDVLYDPTAGTATWTSLDGSGDGALGDIPLDAVAFDPNTGDLYVSCDFAVFRNAGSNTTINWTLAAPGMPNVEVAGLTIVPAARKLYAATHGLSAWVLNLP